MGFDKNIDWKHVPSYFECLCGVFLQLMLLIAFLKDPLKCFRNSAVYLVANLSVADLCVCVRSLLTIVLDPEMISMEFLAHSTIVASLLSILSIAIDRYFMVSHPIKHRLYTGKKMMILWVAFIWILSSTESIKQLIMDKESSYDDLVRNCCYMLIALGTFTFNIATFKHLRKQSKSLSQLQNNHSVEHRAQQVRILNERRLLKTIVIICCVALVTILPNAIFNQVMQFSYEGHQEENESGDSLVRIILHGIWIVHFIINPVLYLWRLPKYRKTFCIIYCCRR
jgi:hypothetical protein